MRRFFANSISVIYSFFRFIFLKLLHPRSFFFSPIQRFSPNVVIEISKGGHLILGKKTRVHSGTKIKVRKNSKLVFGECVKINYNCIIVCRQSVEIGSGTEFGPGVLVFDHDHDYCAGLKNDLFKSAPIKIGNNCWIGANSIILRGTSIGDNVVIGAGCVVKGNIPSNTVLIQKRDTCLKEYKIDE